jgi:hypothetical protein
MQSYSEGSLASREASHIDSAAISEANHGQGFALDVFMYTPAGLGTAVF